MTDSSGTKVAIVTGGSRGLGKDMALALGAGGIGVILTYQSRQSEADSVVQELQALGVGAAALALDVARTTSFDDFYMRVQALLRERWGVDRFDFLVNNAGIGKTIPIDALAEDDFEMLLNVHYKGVVFLTQKALRMMNDDGGVVFITAAADRYHVPGYSTYAACKGAVEVFSRYVAKEYGPRRIRANTVAPGGIVTDFNNAAIRGNPQAQQFIVAQTPMGRLGEARDIGGIVAFLCSDAARWVTGQRIEATGGFNL